MKPVTVSSLVMTYMDNSRKQIKSKLIEDKNNKNVSHHLGKFLGWFCYSLSVVTVDHKNQTLVRKHMEQRSPPSVNSTINTRGQRSRSSVISAINSPGIWTPEDSGLVAASFLQTDNRTLTTFITACLVRSWTVHIVGHLFQKQSEP